MTVIVDCGVPGSFRHLRSVCISPVSWLISYGYVGSNIVLH